jgi:hypothetical protein
LLNSTVSPYKFVVVEAKGSSSLLESKPSAEGFLKEVVESFELAMNSVEPSDRVVEDASLGKSSFSLLGLRGTVDRERS